MPKIRVTAVVRMVQVIYTDRQGEAGLADAWQRAQAELDRGEYGCWVEVSGTVSDVRLEE